MTVSELNAKLFALGGAPEGVWQSKSVETGERCYRFLATGEPWSPAYDIAAAIEMAERLCETWGMLGHPKEYPKNMALMYRADVVRDYDLNSPIIRSVGEADTPAFALSDAVRKALEAKPCKS